MSAAELDRLRDRIAELEHALGMTAAFPRALLPHLYPRREGEILLGALLARDFLPWATLFDMLFGARKDSEQPRSASYPKVIVHQLRKTLRPHGITITTRFGLGVYMADADKAKLRALIARYEGRAA